MSKTRFDILASAAQTATGQGGQISVAGIKSLGLFVDVTNVSGTLSALYLQGSSDGGTTWYDLLAEASVILTSGSTAATSSTSWGRNINIDAMSSGAVRKIWASYPRCFGDYVRAAWVLSGTSATFSVKGIGEN